ncbi:Sec-independent protein translocase protein TatB [Pseudemcibacter aquimaris]|uniref:Sec-independent protein translocase protein TatB n=1 Tax=Pseudemcibacter aquimaris TaxID=2857064 RepID=UPI0020124FF9|nr:Sec-independent protein translocase protein TatB [Pseudemcibacter aquimaris]MCC3860536.1 Sec-independent protein translocase protein TatB [Pseudemcibacter aquimaris]WDU59360.1 Sec-independent protein translocase protein TatB [Pseudemcibacter aquimaris]
MFDVGFQELFIVAVLAIVVVGPKDLPKVIRSVMGMINKVREMGSEFQAGMKKMADEVELEAVTRKLNEAGNVKIDDNNSSSSSTTSTSSSSESKPDFSDYDEYDYDQYDYDGYYDDSSASDKEDDATEEDAEKVEEQATEEPVVEEDVAVDVPEEAEDKSKVNE